VFFQPFLLLFDYVKGAVLIPTLYLSGPAVQLVFAARTYDLFPTVGLGLILISQRQAKKIRLRVQGNLISAVTAIFSCILSCSRAVSN
jgi:hypothetical protein